MAWLEVEMANGLELDIPDHSVLSFEALLPNKHPEAPEANSFIRYDIGKGMQVEPLNTAFEELERKITKAHAGRFIRLTQNDGTGLYIPQDSIISMVAIKESDDPEMKARCQITSRIGDRIFDFYVQETNEQVKILRGDRSNVKEPYLGPPPGKGRRNKKQMN